MKKIAWIGTGVMGASMARNLKNSGYVVHVYNRTPEKAKALEEFGLVAFTSIQEAIKDVDIVFTIVGFPSDVEEVYFGKNGIFKHGKPGLIAVDMTTSSPSLAKRLFEEGKQHQIHVVDAPVSGGDIGAKNATLSIMVGGNKEDFDMLYPVFECLGKRINYMGVAGNGQHTKMANQIAVAGAIAAASEAIVYAKHAGLDPQGMLDAISAGAAGSWQLLNNAPKIINEDFEPGFFIKHFIKDMRLAKDSINEHNIDLEMLSTVCKMYEELQHRGYEDDGTQALIKYYETK